MELTTGPKLTGWDHCENLPKRRGWQPVSVWAQAEDAYASNISADVTGQLGGAGLLMQGSLQEFWPPHKDLHVS